MKRLYLLLLIIIAQVSTSSEVYSQTRQSEHMVAEETLNISASSATILRWFEIIEKECGIVLSYNPAMIDLDKKVNPGINGTTTVGTLLRAVLKDYDVNISSMPPRKLIIQATKKKTVCISGTVYEDGSNERLYGAIVRIDRNNNDRQIAQTDAGGLFRIYAPQGNYKIIVSYIGYKPDTLQVNADKDRFLSVPLKPLAFEIEGPTIEKNKEENELCELAASNMLSFSKNDLFAQIWILPGVISSPAGNNLQADGGSTDENLFLLDGVPVFHHGHFNSLMPMFNGDAIKNIVFHKGFFSTRFEGKLSSVTEVNLKDGNKNEYVNTLSLDMPAASVTMEGPIVKNKLSYMISARRSWLDFFDNMRKEEDRLNHATYDYNAKLSYDISKRSSLSLMAYGARDDYRMPTNSDERKSVLRWDNQIYQLSYRTMLGKLENSTSLFYSEHVNRARLDMFGLDDEGYIHSGIKSLNASTEFSYSADNIYKVRWGAKYSFDTYDLAAFGDNLRPRHELISQVSVFYDNRIRVTQRMSIQAGVHGIGYFPHGNKYYYSIQPRFSLRYFPWNDDMIYLNFSRMEQFYHCLRLSYLDMPTDFRMPSIDGYKPRTSEHYEAGWKHFMDGGLVEISLYYKTRHNLMAFRPDAFVEDNNWNQYIMTGDGDSFGIRLYMNKTWKRWLLQLSYSYSRSREWFDILKERGKMPSLYDVPHQVGAALSYRLNKHSLVSVGGMAHSGKVIDYDFEFADNSEDTFRTTREPMNYRVDVGYTFEKSFGKRLLSLRCGLYNVIGRPSEEDLQSFYSISLKGNCLPYGSISFRF